MFKKKQLPSPSEIHKKKQNKAFLQQNAAILFHQLNLNRVLFLNFEAIYCSNLNHFRTNRYSTDPDQSKSFLMLISALWRGRWIGQWRTTWSAI